MNNENTQSQLSTTDNNTKLWNDSEQVKAIREIYAPMANEGEFKTFIEIGKASHLNPFLREIWLVKYDKSKAAQIFVGRDGYRKVIGRNPNYLSHIVDAVYENDQFMVDNQTGNVNHKYNLQNRGRLLGAYCCVYMKSTPRPFFVYAELSEYNSNQSLWRSKPATMIKKVAECQCIRMAIPSELNGTYVPEEMEKPAYETSVVNKNLGVDAVREKFEQLQRGVTVDQLSEDYQVLYDQIVNSNTLDDLQLTGELIQQAGLDSQSRMFFAEEYKKQLNKLREENA